MHESGGFRGARRRPTETRPDPPPFSALASLRSVGILALRCAARLSVRDRNREPQFPPYTSSRHSGSVWKTTNPNRPIKSGDGYRRCVAFAFSTAETPLITEG